MVGRCHGTGISVSTILYLISEHIYVSLRRAFVFSYYIHILLSEIVCRFETEHAFIKGVLFYPIEFMNVKFRGNVFFIQYCHDHLLPVTATGLRGPFPQSPISTAVC